MLAKKKTFEVIKEIYQTFDYGMFEFMPGNRNINQGIIKRMIKDLKESIKESNLPFITIRVTPKRNNRGIVKNKYWISDGQHRYITLKSVGAPINYFIVDNETIHDIRLLNSNTSNWSLWDYVESYASSKNINYMKILKLKELFPNFRQNELYVAIAMEAYKSVRNGQNKYMIKNGEFIFNNYNKALSIFAKLNDFDIIEGVSYLNYKFIRAALYLIINDKYDHDQMIRKLQNSNYIMKVNSVDGYIEELLKKYNFGCSTRLYFHEIKKR